MEKDFADAKRGLVVLDGVASFGVVEDLEAGLYVASRGMRGLPTDPFGLFLSVDMIVIEDWTVITIGHGGNQIQLSRRVDGFRVTLLLEGGTMKGKATVAF